MITYKEVKRVMDIFLAIFLSILFLPVWIVIPILIWFDSPGPMIYKQKRVGLNGKQFGLYKFRTMIKGADEILFKKRPKLLRKFKRGDWKLKRDPRVTKLGRLLRNLTIDEFPQFWNVLRGEMSIVGPRAYRKPELKEQVKKYPSTKKWIPTILSAKPGITGPWQTSGRNVIPFDKRAKMDFEYARNYSFLKDFVIILKTPMAMISKW